MKEVTQEDLKDFMKEVARLAINITTLSVVLGEKISNLEKRIEKLEGKK